jgi:hypothetical protein
MLRTTLNASLLAAALALVSGTIPSAAAPFGIVQASHAKAESLKLPMVSIHHAPWHTGGRGKHKGWSKPNPGKHKGWYKGVRGKGKAKGQRRGRR